MSRTFTVDSLRRSNLQRRPILLTGGHSAKVLTSSQASIRRASDSSIYGFSSGQSLHRCDSPSKREDMHSLGLKSSLSKAELVIVNRVFADASIRKRKWECNDVGISTKISQTDGPWLDLHSSNRRMNVKIDGTSKLATFEEDILDEEATLVAKIQGQVRCASLTVTKITANSNGDIHLYITFDLGARLSISHVVQGFEHPSFASLLQKFSGDIKTVKLMKICISQSQLAHMQYRPTSTVGPEAMGLETDDEDLVDMDETMHCLSRKLDSSQSSALTYNNMRAALAAAAKAEHELESCGQEDMDHWLEFRRIAIQDYNTLGNIAVWERRLAQLSAHKEQYIFEKGLRRRLSG